MRRAMFLLSALIIALAVGLGVTMQRGTPTAGVAIIGDKSQDLLKETGLSQALPLHTAALTVVSVEEWFKLRYVEDMHALCGATCMDGTGLVRILRLSPTGSSRVLIVNHEALNSAKPIACVADVVRAELTDGLKTRPPCARDVTQANLWAVPGLGTF